MADEPQSFLESEEEQEHPSLRPHAKSSGRSRQLTFEELAQYFNVTAQAACRELGVGLVVLRRACRRFGLLRWPYRKGRSAAAGKPGLQSHVKGRPRRSSSGTSASSDSSQNSRGSSAAARPHLPTPDAVSELPRGRREADMAPWAAANKAAQLAAVMGGEAYAVTSSDGSGGGSGSLQQLAALLQAEAPGTAQGQQLGGASQTGMGQAARLVEQLQGALAARQHSSQAAWPAAQQPQQPQQAFRSEGAPLPWGGLAAPQAVRLATGAPFLWQQSQQQQEQQQQQQQPLGGLGSAWPPQLPQAQPSSAQVVSSLIQLLQQQLAEQLAGQIADHLARPLAGFLAAAPPPAVGLALTQQAQQAQQTAPAPTQAPPAVHAPAAPDAPDLGAAMRQLLNALGLPR